MARGLVVADAAPTEIKAMVGTRTIRATLAGPGVDELLQIPGVTGAERHGEAIVLVCSDSDTALRALLDFHSEARDIEITGAGLEQAFVQLTASDDREEVAV
jgi:ABC-2 type transport system ATP-binding protein